MINHKACEISFDLDCPIQIASGSGDLVDAKSITFRKPNRQTGPIFQNLLSMFNVAMTKQMSEMKSIASEEEVEKAQQLVREKQAKAEAESAMQSILNVTFEEVMEEVDGMIMMATSMEFDFEKGYRLFDKIILSSDRGHVICELGGKKLTDGMLDKVDYQDMLRMLMVYISFFGKPVRAGTTNDSDKQPESVSPATEV